MIEQTCQQEIDRTVQLSQAPLNYDGAKNINFTTSVVKISDFEKFFKSNNYSAIEWEGGIRKADNFRSASGFFVDIDEAMKIEESESILKSKNLNYALITTRSHTPEVHRFRIFIPFSRTVYTYTQYRILADEINKILNSKCDTAVFDGARFLFGSPKDASYRCYWSGRDFQVESNTLYDFSKIENGDWDDSLLVRGSDGKDIPAKTITVKTSIHCPFHEDSNASAFIEYSKDSENWFIHCSTCNKTFWKAKKPLPIEDKCKNYWSYGKDIIEIGIIGEKFFMEKNSEKKVYARTHAKNSEDKDKIFNHLATKKHISHLKRVDYLGDIHIEQSSYNFLEEQGIIEVRYAALPEHTKDNDFIERYLEQTFGRYKSFIKEYLAMYCYTNYKDLPTLIFKGERGCGKNTFAETIAEIYKPISQMWNGHEGSFNPEVEMKLLIADETVSNDPKQYKMLKKYSGANHFMVNHKYLRQYEVKNNMNIIILSNANTPIYVEKDEQPTDECNNQFFVYQFHKFNEPIDPDMGMALKRRLGHYIRTELRDLYPHISTTGNRYSIKTPITEEEKLLFANNTTEVSDAAELFIERISEIKSGTIYPDLKGFIENGYVPSKIFSEYLLPKGVSKVQIIKNLTDRGYLRSPLTAKEQINKERLPVYYMTAKLTEQLQA